MATRIAHGSDPFTAADGVADLLVERLVVAVEAQVAVAVVDDQKVAETPQPVGENDPPGRDRFDVLPGLRCNEEALPDHAAILPWTAEAAGKFPTHGQSELTAQL